MIAHFERFEITLLAQSEKIVEISCPKWALIVIIKFKFLSKIIQFGHLTITSFEGFISFFQIYLVSEYQIAFLNIHCKKACYSDSLWNHMNTLI